MWISSYLASVAILVGCDVPSPSIPPRVQLDSAVCALSETQPKPESACDDRRLVDLYCVNTMVGYYRNVPTDYPHYCFGLRVRASEVTRYVAAKLNATYSVRELCK